MKDIKVGVIGFGTRGRMLMRDNILAQNECVTAVCDLYEDRAQAAEAIVYERTGKHAKIYLDYKELLNDENVNTVVIAASWEAHVGIAIDAMEKGMAVALEVGGAYSLEDCFRLVETYERTHAKFVFLENCCFGRREMTVLNMVRKGVFGEIVHCAGGYHHDLRGEVSNGIENRHYRFRNYVHRNCENYPTHELGPIMKVLNINRGNRLMTLTSTASKAAGLKEYLKDTDKKDTVFCQGDIVTTVIKCANGESIVLTLDTTLPRYYSRDFTVRGTKGMYEESTDSVFLDTEEDIAKDSAWKSEHGNMDKYDEEYLHPVWKKYIEEGVRPGHDGIDWLEIQYFFDALRNDKPVFLDIYDAATLMCITPLSEQSIALGGAPMNIPDFTHGQWQSRTEESEAFK